MSFEVKENTFYKLKDLNKELGYTIFTLRHWIKNGQLKASKIGRDYIISSETLKNFLGKGITTLKKNKKKVKK